MWARWDNPTLFHRAKSIETNIEKRQIFDTINWEKLFSPYKIYWKKYWKKVNINTITWEIVLDRSAEHKQCNILLLINFKLLIIMLIHLSFNFKLSVLVVEIT